MLSKPLVDQIQAPAGKVVVIENNHASITMGDGRRIRRLFVDVPPQPIHPLVGRDEVLAEVRAKLSGDDGVAAVSAVNGLAGVGKTALAVGLAYDEATLDHFKGGVLWIGLGPNGDTDSALNRWGTALGAELGAAPDASARARRLSLALQEKAQGAPVLLIVDDVWRWEQARPFREIAFPGCAHLLTTRDAEIGRKFAGRATSLGQLSNAQAEALLAERCPEAKAADAEGLRQLARAVGGLPLGLTLIAGKLDVSVGQVRWVRGAIERLRAVEARLELEAPESRPGLEGVPNTLRAIVELSVAALEQEEQQAFAALGAFAPKPADFSRDAALAVWVVKPERGDDDLRRLVNRGLLETAGEDRFALHQVLATVAAVRLGDEKGPRERHARFYRRFVDEDREAWAKIEAELEQIRRAWGWIRGALDNDVETLAYVYALRIFFERRGLWKEHLEWADGGLSSARALKRSTDEATLLNNIGAVHRTSGDNKRALEFFERARPLRRAIGDRAGEATTLNNIGAVHRALKENQRALEFYGLALPLLRAVGDRAGEAITLNNIGAVHRASGENQRALEFYELALPLLRAVGDRAGEAITLNNIGAIHRASGENQRALDFYERALPLRRAVGDRAGEANTLNNIGSVYSASGENQRALDFYERALPLRRAAGDHAGEAATLNNIGLVHRDLGENQRALEFYERALPLQRTVGDRAGEAATLNNIGLAHRDLGENKRALEFYERALPLLQKIGDRVGEAVTLFNIARRRSEEGDTAEAIALLERVVEIDEALQRPDLTSDRAVLEQLRKKQQASTIQSAPAYRGASRLPWLLAALALLTTITWLIFSR